MAPSSAEARASGGKRLSSHLPRAVPAVPAVASSSGSSGSSSAASGGAGGDDRAAIHARAARVLRCLQGSGACPGQCGGAEPGGAGLRNDRSSSTLLWLTSAPSHRPWLAKAGRLTSASPSRSLVLGHHRPVPCGLPRATGIFQASALPRLAALHTGLYFPCT
jgi:hypothetical protein